jgi:hypothetical protein
MRRLIFGLVCGCMLASGAGCVSTRGTYYEPGSAPPAQVQDFQQALSPYGEWLDVPGYGRVWRPSPAVVGSEFRPYATGGHWVYTDYGWAFESDWPWGWAPFHYGRWALDAQAGWLWVPGTVWAPAWVSWRFGGGLVGWAPLPPVGASIVIGSYQPAWCFVETRYLVAPRVYAYAVPPARVHTAFAVTTVLPQQVNYAGARWYAGPPAQHIAQAAGHPVQPVAVAPPRPGVVRPTYPQGHAPAAVPNAPGLSAGNPRAYGALPRAPGHAPQTAPGAGPRPPSSPPPPSSAAPVPGGHRPAPASRPSTHGSRAAHSGGHHGH